LIVTCIALQENFGEEQIQYNMEKIGYRVGFSLVEKATKEEARFKENVEIVKYICKVSSVNSDQYTLIRLLRLLTYKTHFWRVELSL
jgi:hypothetical protein